MPSDLGPKFVPVDLPFGSLHVFQVTIVEMQNILLDLDVSKGAGHVRSMDTFSPF
jgi:hypothetical protein